MRNVLLVDDHPIVRQGIARILSTGIGNLRLDEADDGPTAVHRLRHRRFDLVLLDLTLPGDSGLGPRGTADQVVVDWPSGTRDTVGPLTPWRSYVITEGRGVTVNRPLSTPR